MVWHDASTRFRRFIKLIDPKTIPPQGSPNLEDNLGFRYLTLQVSNIDELCEELGNKGIEFTLEKKEYMPGVTIAMVKDRWKYCGIC